jgi:predicted exporter
MMRWWWMAVVLPAALLAALALRNASGQMSALLPESDPALTRQAHFFAAIGTARMLMVEIAGPGPAAQEVTNRLIERVRPLGAHQTTAAGAAQAATTTQDHLDLLLLPEELDALTPRLTPESLHQQLERIRERALQPDDTLAATIAASDPLALGAIPLASLLQDRRGTPDGPTLVHPDGVHRLLPLSIDFPPEDLDRSARLLDALTDEATQAKSSGLTIAITGSYRHYVENSRTVWNDLTSTGPIGLALVGITLWSLLGRFRILVAVHVPALLGILGALAGAGIWSLITGRPMPLTMLGFAAGLLGIAVDYGTHVATGAALGHRPVRELVTTYLTTAAAFAVLLSADSPAIQCLGAMVVGGLSLALAASLTLLPSLLPPADGRDRWSRISTPVLAWAQARPRHRLLLAALLTLVALPGLTRLHFEQDLRRYDGSSAGAWSDLEAVLSRWGAPDGSAYLIGKGADRREAVAIAAAARAQLGLPMDLLERLLPNAAEQVRRRTAWNQRWLATPFDPLLTEACRSTGLRRNGFQTALAKYAPVAIDAPGILDHTWDHTAFGTLVSSRMVELNGRCLAAIPLSGLNAAQVATLARQLPPGGQAWIASRSDLGTRVVQTLRDDLVLRTGAIAVLILVVVLLAERSIGRTLAILLPVATALVWTFGMLGWIGISLSPFSLLAAAFLCGIGIDSAVFLASCRGPASLSPILNASITTIVGMGAMAMTHHPVVRSIGISLTIGMTAILGAALLIVPALTQRQNSR